jgi:hypothetical protein
MAIKRNKQMKIKRSLKMEMLISFRSMYYRPPLWSSGQSSWLQIQRSGWDSRRYQIFWEVVGLTGLEIRVYDRRDLWHRPRGTLYPQKFALTSSTSGGRSVDIVRWRTQATEFLVFNA